MKSFAKYGVLDGKIFVLEEGIMPLTNAGDRAE
jgi:hypothetical protein